MKRNKKLLLLGLMGALLLALAGCSSTKTPVTATSGGFWDHYFVYPLSMALTKIAEWAGGSYGLSIIIATVIIRLVLLPLILKQQKSTMAMQALRPEMEKIQKDTAQLKQQLGVIERKLDALAPQRSATAAAAAQSDTVTPPDAVEAQK